MGKGIGGEKPYEQIKVPNNGDNMSTTDFFPEAFDYTINNEGGFVNNPHDHGGPTNWGIIQTEYSAFLGRPASVDDVRRMPKSDAEAIYKKKYWNSLSLGSITHKHVAMALFDRSILNGLLGVSRYVREILGEHETGMPNFIGDIAKVNAQDPVKFVLKLADLCEASHRARVAAHPDQAVFLKGWINRVQRLRDVLGKA